MKLFFLKKYIVLLACNCFGLLAISQYNSNLKTLKPKTDSNFLYLKPFIFSSNYQTLGWGFFCKKEWEFEKATKIPIRFRLGTVEYTNRLEGKN